MSTHHTLRTTVASPHLILEQCCIGLCQLVNCTTEEADCVLNELSDGLNIVSKPIESFHF